MAFFYRQRDLDGRFDFHQRLDEDMGGTKIVVKGVGFWANESPPWKLAIFGVPMSEIGADYGTKRLSGLRSQLVAKKSAAVAVIQINGK